MSEAPAHPTYGPWIMYEKVEPPPAQFIIVPAGTPPEAIGLPPGTAPVKGPFFMPSPTPPGQTEPPLVIWGPGDPRPTLPISGWDPGTGTWPKPPVQPPLGIWGPTDPRPTLPIAGWDPGTGTWWPIRPPQPPLIIWGPGDPRPTLPIAGWDPGTGTFPGRPTEPPVTPVRDGQTPATALYVINMPPATSVPPADATTTKK